MVERSSFLLKYYTKQSDDPEFDLIPAMEKTIEWIRDMQARMSGVDGCPICDIYICQPEKYAPE